MTIKVCYDCKRGLGGGISDCKLVIHAKCFDVIRKIYDRHRKDIKGKHKSISTGIIMTSLDEQKYVITTG